MHHLTFPQKVPYYFHLTLRHVLYPLSPDRYTFLSIFFFVVRVYVSYDTYPMYPTISKNRHIPQYQPIVMISHMATDNYTICKEKISLHLVLFH